MLLFIFFSFSFYGSPQLVLGIITLTKTHQIYEGRGLAIASGVLAILGGCMGANAIVSLIAFKKITIISNNRTLQEAEDFNQNS